MSRPFNVERLLSLRQQHIRNRENLYLAEGLRFVLAALNTQAPLAALFVAPKLLRHPVGQLVARRSRRRGFPVISLQPEEYAQLTDAPEPAGIGVVLRQRWLTPEQALAARPDCWLAIEQIRSPGNLGTIVRTCEAANAPGIILLGPPAAADPYHPAAVQSSLGAVVTRSFVRLSAGIPGVGAARRLPRRWDRPGRRPGLPDGLVSASGRVGAWQRAARLVTRAGDSLRPACAHTAQRADRFVECGGRRRCVAL